MSIYRGRQTKPDFTQHEWWHCTTFWTTGNKCSIWILWKRMEKDWKEVFSRKIKTTSIKDFSAKFKSKRLLWGTGLSHLEDGADGYFSGRSILEYTGAGQLLSLHLWISCWSFVGKKNGNQIPIQDTGRWHTLTQHTSMDIHCACGCSAKIFLFLCSAKVLDGFGCQIPQ